MAHHTTSKHNSYASIKELGWGIQAIIQSFVKQDKAQIAARMKADGYRTSQIARAIYGEANKNTMTQVGKLLKEVA